MPWLQRWIARLMNAVKNAFGLIYSDPYKLAAYKMLNSATNQYKDAAAGITSTEEFLQAESLDASPEQEMSIQGNTVRKLLDGHHSIRLDQNLLKSAIKGTNYKILRTLMDQDEDGTFARYIIDQGPGQSPIIITNRTTDETTRQFIKKVGLFRAQEINQSDKAAHARKHGTNLHGAAQLLVEKLATKMDSLDVVQTDDAPGNFTFAEIQKKSGLRKAALFNNFKKGTQEVLDTIEATQAKINGKDGKGKVKLLTELRLYNKYEGKGTGTAGTMDLIVVYSDGTVGIFDWKFMTPPWQYTEGYGQNKRIVEDPWAIKMDGWNTQIGLYKRMLKDVYGIKNDSIKQSRIIPAHVEYEVKDANKGDYTLTDNINVFEMGEGQNPLLSQVAVAKEYGSTEGLQKILKGLYERRDKLLSQMKNVKSQKESYAALKSKYLSTLQAIQEVSVKEDVMHLININSDHIAKVEKHLHKNDINEDGYLGYDQLISMLEDLTLFKSLNTDVTGYIEDLRDKGVPEKTIKATQTLFDKSASKLQRTIDAIRSKMFERLSDEASKVDEDITDSPLQLGWWARHLTQMDEMDHPVFRLAMNSITESFNKQKQVTDGIFDEIQLRQKALEKWGEKNGMTLAEVYEKKLIKDTITKDAKGNEKIQSRNLMPKFTDTLYEEIKKRKEAKDVKWFKLNFKLKDDWRTIYSQRKKNKNLEIEYLKTAKNKKASLRNFEKFNNFIVEDEAWLSDMNRWVYLELKKPEDFYSTEYKEMLKPENKALLDFYEMYHKHNKNFQAITGKSQLRPGFIANRQDGVIESVINNGFNINKFYDAMARPFATREDDQTIGVRGENGYVDQIPLPYMDAIRNSKGEVDYSLKSLDLGKSLYALSLGVYNYKYMSEIEGKIMALKDYLHHTSQETKTDYLGRRVIDEAGQPVEEATSQETLATFDKFVKYYVYGQRIQDKRQVVAGIDLVKVIPALQSIYSMKVLSLAVVPGIAARTVGGINMFLEGIDGVNYT